ncbi:hypothetical protein [Bacillus sp. FJAT-22090]|uniref:hypothetical protein n=1 Tax=Bacillus sp. FJAT-22090 TaxID=1581038 RepID=UPI00119E5FA5|nr:hypothetical protein [Bacillus sp. FJAT-22090]
MKQLLKKLLIAVVIFIIATVLFLAAIVKLPHMSNAQMYILIGIYLVISQIGFAFDRDIK